MKNRMDNHSLVMPMEAAILDNLWVSEMNWVFLEISQWAEKEFT